MSSSGSDDRKPAQGARGTRRRRLAIIAVAAVVLVGATAAWLHGRAGVVSTNDARVAADVIAVSSEVSGRVVQLDVRAGDAVRKGQLLVRIEPRDAEYALSALDANLASLDAQAAQLRAQQSAVQSRVGREVAVSSAGVSSAQAEYLAREAELAAARSAFARTKQLFDRNLVARSRFDEDQARLRAAEQTVERARSAISGAQAGVDVTRSAADQIGVLEQQIAGIAAQKRALSAQRDQRTLDLSRREIRAAFDGVIDQTFVEAGEYVAPGARILLYHDPKRVWVEVNVKETEVRKVARGAPAIVKLDAYPGRSFPASVERIGGAATSQFALLPNPNPSGNFTKVTQRLPVRLSINQTEGLLRPGMMAEVSIDVVD